MYKGKIHYNIMFCNKCNNYYSLSKTLPNDTVSASGYYICNNCSNWKKIPDHTLLYQKKLKNIYHDNNKYTALDIHPRVSMYKLHAYRGITNTI
uniref:Uncharacterized protein n=1 Tax=Megaviridae environmental sample TaxID=1737588 RepID=A0A5J6VJ68_9VIRU|nr:MAG: hypothetical protein [Megaviridae environmental sample]